MKKVALALSMLALFVSNVDAKNNPISLTTKSFKEVVKVEKDGKKSIHFVDAKKVIPGDIVLYKNIIQNNSKEEAKDLVLNNQIPKHTTYIANSAKCESGCEILFSVDHGKSFKKADELMVKEGSKRRLALPSEYTNVRWILSSALSPNAKTYVSFKTKLK